MIHLGDITKIKGNEAPVVDCIIGGSPCQDLSVAGKRAGLAGERSGLFMEQIRVIKEMRENDKQSGRTGVDVRPRYGIWENVPGALSSPGKGHAGEDFAAVIEEFIRVAEPEAPSVSVPEKGWPTAGCLYDEMGKWSVAWRVMDAQYWGVPQRRRRICLCADFNGLNAPKIVFGEAEHHGSTERGGKHASVGHSGTKPRSKVQPVTEGLPRNTESCQPKGKEAAGDAGNGAGGAGNRPITFQWQAGSEASLCVGDNIGPSISCTRVPAVAVPKAIGCDLYNGSLSVDKAITLVTNANATGFGPTVAVPKAIGFPLGFRPENVRCYDEVATTLCNGTRPGFTTGVIQSVIAKRDGAVGFDGFNQSLTGDKSKPLTSAATDSDHIPVVFQPLCIEMTSTHNTIITDGICPTLTARMGTGGNQVNAVTEPVTDADRVKYIVRRLTPLECERLQGFPDGWTNIGDWVDSKGKKHKAADSPRYKALGNSIALPPWRWILKRLCACYERDATMASLFDGIGGFPLIWEQLNGKGSCLWASEIEEFPIAVTKLRFGGNDNENHVG